MYGDEHLRLVVWMRKHRASRGQAFTAKMSTYVCALDGVPVLADSELRLTASDNKTGAAELKLTTRPHLLGAVSMEMLLTTRGVHATRPTTRRASFEAPPAVMRELAAALLDAADGADRNAKALKPCLVQPSVVK
jgi:hypothetical protein